MTLLVRVCLLAITTLACTSSDREGEGAARETASPRVPARGGEPEEWVVRPDGFGPVTFGAPLSATSAALGEEVRAGYADFETCDYVRPKALPTQASLMVINDTVMRVDIDSAGVRTAEGAQVGDAEARVLELYRGRVSVEPHKYTGPEGHYLVVIPAGDTLHRIIFETDGQRVTQYRAGRRPAVEFVEGCA